MTRSTLALATALTLLMGAAAATGLLAEGLYRDNLLVRAAWQGNDLVTLVLAVPLMFAAALAARCGSRRGLLAWLGMVAYALYNYAFYLFGAAYNSLFMIYVAILILSTFGLILGLTSPDLGRVVRTARIGRAERGVGVLIITVALALGSFWVGTSLGHLWTGEIPAMVTAVGHPTNVTGALDLWLVVSFGFLGGIWLWRRRPWGYVIGVIWTVKGAVYMTALSAASIAAFARGAVDDMAQLWLWVPMGIGSTIGAIVLLRTRLAGDANPGQS
jgi:hypothetical protein